MHLNEDIVILTNYIGGEQKAPTTGQYLDCTEPATAVVYGKAPASNSEDVEVAVRAAKSAQPGWKELSRWQRSEWLRKLADGIRDRAADFALAESDDTGKPLTTAERVDIPRAQKNFNFFADAGTQFYSESHSSATAINYTQRDPVGVVACISPWNLPLYLLSWKIAPALAAGNTVVAKPSEVTPFTAFMLGQVAEEIGLPAGVLNIVHGTGPQSGASLVTHPEIGAVSFTGSTATGRKIATGCAESFKKVSLEMGGKNATIVFADSDYPNILDEVVRSAFANQGEICLCGSRILVEESISSRFIRDFQERVAALRVGDPRDSKTDIGALVSQAHYQKVLQYIDLAKHEGGRILTGGRAAEVDGRCEAGWFVQPTVIAGLGNDCRTNQEEIFGPVVTIQSFKSLDEAVHLANNTRYGLSASVWTQNISTAQRVAANLQAGIVWINCWMERDLRTPFGGVKESGYGREGGFEALRFFTEPKNICIKYT